MYKTRLYILLIILTLQTQLYGQTVTIKNGTTFKMSKGATLYINGGLTVETGATVTCGNSATDSATIQLTGNCNFNGTYNQNGGSLWFVGNTNQDFSGLNSINRFIINKTSSRVYLKNNITVSNNLRLLGGLLDIDNYNLIFDINAELFSNLDTAKYYTSFSETKSIYCSKGYTGGLITRKINTAFPTFYYSFPVSIPDTKGNTAVSIFAPALVNFWYSGSATFGTDPSISMNAHYKEHLRRLIPRTLLKQYWKFSANNVTINPIGGVHLKFQYANSQVNAIEDDYQVLYYAPSYPASGFWNVNPADAANTINFTTNTVTISNCDFLEGDWTVGDLPAFFSIANGNWTTATSWSKRGYNGVAAATAPPDYAHTFIGNSKTITVSSTVTVNQRNTIDSSGIISFTLENYLTGTGEFRIKKFGGIEVGSTAGVTLTGATGNVRTSTRNYNYLEHDRSNFTYTNTTASAQAIGTGLPDTVNKFIVRRGALARTVNLTKYVTVNNIMHIESGTLNTTANVYLEGNLRVGTLADGKAGYINPNTYSFTFFGLTQDTIFHQSRDSIVFYNLVINKLKQTGDVLLKSNACIAIRNNLSFHSNNQSQIVARESGTYVQLIGNGTTGATVTGAGPGGDYGSCGWVDGDMRKYVIKNGPNQLFEVGDSKDFTPFSIYSNDYKDIHNGYASIKVMTGTHPYLYASYANLLTPTETALRWWRLMQPSYSAFIYDDKLCSVKAWLLNPDDITNTGSFECMDMALWDGRDSRLGWLYCDPRDHGFNSDFSGDGCINVRNDKIPGWTYASGSAYSDNNVFIEATQNAENYKFQPRLVFTESDGDKLIFDYVFGNSNSFKGGYTYYSAKSGYWDDPTTWSTVSHTSTVNNGGTTYSNKYPIRQFDRAYIGGSDTVKLRSSIGNADYSVTNGTGRYQFRTGPNTYVESDGTIDLGTNVLYGLFFGITPGGKIIVGSSDGLVHRDSLGIWPSRIGGAIRTVNRNYNDSISIIYKPMGHTAPKYSTVVNTYPYYNIYCQASMNSANRFIQSVRLSSGATSLMYNNTGSTLTNVLNFTDFSATVQPGNSYTLDVAVNGTGSPRRLQVWVDLDYNGIFDHPKELLINENFSGASISQALAIPSDVEPGGTTMRVMFYNVASQAVQSACIENTYEGEVEDYWLNIVKNSTSITQYSGGGIPDTVRAVTVNAYRNNNDVVKMSKRTTITDSLFIKSGKLDVELYNISLYRNFHADSINPLDPKSATFKFIGTPISRIYSAYLPLFYNISAEKTGAGDIDIVSDISVNNNINFLTNSIIDLWDNKRIVLKQDATITSPSAYSVSKMIKVSGKARGTNTPGLVRKEWNTTAGVLKSITIPFGITNSLNTAELSFNQTDAYSGVPALNVQLFDSIHANSSSTNTLKKFWKISSENLGNLTSRLFKFYYVNSDTNGTASKYSIALYNSLNGWSYNLGDILSAYPSPLIANSTSGNYDQVDGDWTARFRKGIFYSRATGLWNAPSSWTNNQSHNGPALTSFPTSTEDSVVIGTGLAGQHTITMTQTVTISGLNLGTSLSNQGTLNTNSYILNGNNFIMGEGSTLMVTSPDGISAVGQADANLGNIRTTYRDYGGLTKLTNFIYNGTTNQNIGSGLPSSIRNLTINNTGLAGNLYAGLPGSRVVTVSKNLDIYGNLTITSGTLKLQTYNVNSANATGSLIVNDNTSINIGGTNNMLTSLNNYLIYNITELSFIEFSGSNQIISQLPNNFNLALGFGNVNILDAGIKTVNLPLTIRTNLFVSQLATLQNNVGVNQLFVKKSIINRGEISNEGNIQVCQ